jgi:lysozyme
VGSFVLGGYSFGTSQSAFFNSTLLALLNKGRYHQAADQFYRWTKADGQDLPGLVARRAAERKLFLGE